LNVFVVSVYFEQLLLLFLLRLYFEKIKGDQFVGHV
uniref:Amino acid ABC transporter permease n=1 Tax=Brugia timori TaxID=42155 RepID=A0A0R3QDS4_9BILA